MTYVGRYLARSVWSPPSNQSQRRRSTGNPLDKPLQGLQHRGYHDKNRGVGTAEHIGERAADRRDRDILLQFHDKAVFFKQ